MGNRRFNQILQHRQMREQIEVLKYIAHVNPLAEDLFFFQLIQLVALTAIADIVAINLDKPFIDPFKMVNGAQQRRFSRTGRPQDHRHRSRRNLQGDIIQRFMTTKVFTDPGYRNMTITRVEHGRPPAADEPVG